MRDVENQENMYIGLHFLELLFVQMKPCDQSESDVHFFPWNNLIELFPWNLTSASLDGYKKKHSEQFIISRQNDRRPKHTASLGENAKKKKRFSSGPDSQHDLADGSVITLHNSA